MQKYGLRTAFIKDIVGSSFRSLKKEGNVRFLINNIITKRLSIIHVTC